MRGCDRRRVRRLGTTRSADRRGARIRDRAGCQEGLGARRIRRRDDDSPSVALGTDPSWRARRRCATIRERGGDPADRARGSRADQSGAWIFVECAETTTTAVAVRPGPQGTSEIMACAFAPSTGVLDLGAGADASAGASASAGTDAAPDTGIEAGSAWIAVVNELIDEVSGDEGAGPVCVVGPSAETVARVLSTDSGRDVRVVPEPALVACRTASSESGAGSGSDASEPARRSWVDQVPRPEPVRPTVGPSSSGRQSRRWHCCSRWGRCSPCGTHADRSLNPPPRLRSASRSAGRVPNCPIRGTFG